MNARGHSLVETLVALAVLSYGALCTVGLQLEIRRANLEAAQRAMAARIAHDLAEQMRGSPAAGAAQLSTDPRAEPLSGAAERLDGASVGGLIAPSTCLNAPAGGEGPYTLTLVWRGSVPLPDDEARPCARDPQPDGQQRYSKAASDNALRRTLSLAVWLAAPRR